MVMRGNPDIEAALAVLEKCDEFRVLRRLPVAETFNVEIAEDALIGVVVDVETTGLDVAVDEVLELGMIKFNFDRDGKIGRVLGNYRSFNEPRKSIPNSISELTAIWDADVIGHRISGSEVGRFVSDATIIIAHNASFDRPFCERLFHGFSDMPWACTATEIEWRAEGVSGIGLQHIAYSFGRFFDAHRALDDCNAVVNILSFVLPRSHTPVISALLRSAKQSTVRIFAVGASYNLRSSLKRKDYRWNDGQNGYPRAWWKDVPDEAVDIEISALAALDEAVTINPRLFPMTAKTRFRRKA
jgi:DNA polymerase-3 subunit epsilon